MDRRAVFVLCLLALMTAGWMHPALAQDATPNPADEHLDLAAMALTSDDVPEDFVLGIEIYLAGQMVAENLFSDPDDVAALMDTGLIVIYSSAYNNATGDVTIRSYIEQFESEEGARAGFEILEDESQSESSGIEYADEPLEGVGETPSEITTFSREVSGDSPALDGVDVTFRVDNFLAGVTIEGTGGAAPAKSDAVTLARVLDDRVRMALAGDQLPGIDGSLPGRMLNFNFPPLLEGYVSAVDGFGAAASDELFHDYESGYTRTTPLGQGDQPLPLVTTSISSFASEDGPLAIISGGDEFQPPFEQMSRVDIDPIEGATAVAAFHFVSPLGEGREIDSYRILAVAGSHLVTIDIQAADSEDVARRLAMEFTEQQLGCIDESQCEVIEEVDTGP
jgi:hypothetical protein